MRTVQISSKYFLLLSIQNVKQNQKLIRSALNVKINVDTAMINIRTQTGRTHWVNCQILFLFKTR
jgi:hypothetical protein